MATDQIASCLVCEVITDQKIPLVLSYVVPHEWIQDAEVGKRVEVPIKNRFVKGFIYSLKEEKEASHLKSVAKISKTQAISPKLLELAVWMSKYYVTPLSKVLSYFVPKLIKKQDLDPQKTHGQLDKTSIPQLEKWLQEHHPRKKKVFSFLERIKSSSDSFSLKELKKQLGTALFDIAFQNQWILQENKTHLLEFEPVQSAKKILTDEQKQASAKMLSYLGQNGFSIHLLHGVCGSGKTEVYFELIEEVLKLSKSVIYLVPEVALAPQTIQRLKKRFQVPIALIHHQVSDGIKKQDYEALQKGQIKIAVGARSALFSPMKNLGLIVVDEEHEAAYKQEGMPTYHAKDVAIMRAKLEDCMVVLGSATPSCESYYQALQGKMILHELKHRPNTSQLPDIHLATLGTDFQKAQGLNLFAEPVIKALRKNFEMGEQSLIFINRRGYHVLQQCTSCAEAIKCQNCSIPMTYHKHELKLSCHYCSYEQNVPKECPLCGSETMQFKGVGTQYVESRLQKALPEARILRVDKDTTTKKGAIDNYFEIFSSQGADILIGTQMIAKGLDFSNLTLAIVLNIDGAFNRPDFRAHEEAFQLMTQVAGRAGRSLLKGQVYIQTTNPDHFLCQVAKMQDYKRFYEKEILDRQTYHYPPFSRLVRFVFSDQNLDRLKNYAEMFRQHLLKALPENYIIEPLASCMHEMIDKHYRYQFLIKGPKPIKLYQIIEAIDKKHTLPHSLKRLIDVDPKTTYF